MHHLDPDTHQQAYNNMSRVLKKGGVFWFQCCTPQQQTEGFWWASVIPQGAALSSSKFTGIPLLEYQFAAAGLENFRVDIPAEPLMDIKDYKNVNGPLDIVFRNGDSTWSLARPQELEAG